MRQRFIEDAFIGMIELTHRDKTVLRQLFEAVGNFNAVLGEVRDDPIDHKYLGRVIADVASERLAMKGRIYRHGGNDERAGKGSGKDRKGNHDGTWLPAVWQWLATGSVSSC
jgi:hypothetical protein